ncbi:SAM-dependent methyltransferase [Nakamurella sp. UYEF19]|uniref:class I SAM-dependent methyltransferase n=1 Tax=Nakamurella sp. UYEF19 TaxID=1756392 RepID=UPI003397AC2D
MTAPRAAEFDDWYANMQPSARCAEIYQEYLGLPLGLESSSLLPWEGISTIMGSLDLAAGSTLLDLACGRGGYGLEIARRSGAALIGVDFSTVALARAREMVPNFGMGGRAEFLAGDLADTGLPSGSVDAVVCVDSVQFADPPGAAILECKRVLRPGGRVALTCWQPRDRHDERVPPRLRRIDLFTDLSSAGFSGVQVSEMEQWHAAERRLWEAALAEDAAGDPALLSMQHEAAQVLTTFDLMQRILVTAAAPD